MLNYSFINIEENEPSRQCYCVDNISSKTPFLFNEINSLVQNINNTNKVNNAPVNHTPVNHTPVIHTPVIRTPVIHTPVIRTPVIHTPVNHTLPIHNLNVQKDRESYSSHNLINKDINVKPLVEYNNKVDNKYSIIETNNKNKPTYEKKSDKHNKNKDQNLSLLEKFNSCEDTCKIKRKQTKKSFFNENFFIIIIIIILLIFSFYNK
jgi:hypothetical protein